MLRPDSAKLRTRTAYIAWAAAGYADDYGLSAGDALACAEIDWSLRLEAQSEEIKPPAERLGKVLERKRVRKAQEIFNGPITRPDQRPPRKAAPKPKAKPKVRDFRGVEFGSFEEMCRRWGVSPATVRSRLACGWSLEKALRTRKCQHDGKAVNDHLGNKYPSVSAMCRAYGISTKAWYHRRAIGLSLRQALETPMGGATGRWLTTLARGSALSVRW